MPKRAGNAKVTIQGIELQSMLYLLFCNPMSLDFVETPQQYH